MDFEIVGDVTVLEVIASGRGFRDLARLRRTYGKGRWLANGLSIEALPKPAEPDGRAWTRIRITYFETDDSRFVQEMQMRHPSGVRTGSFEYTDPSKRRYVVKVGR